MAEGNVNDKARMSDPVQEETVQATNTELGELQEMNEILQRLFYFISRPMYVEATSGRMRMSIESGSVGIAANQTIANLSTMNALNNIDARDAAYALNRTSWYQNVGSKL